MLSLFRQYKFGSNGLETNPRANRRAGLKAALLSGLAATAALTACASHAQVTISVNATSNRQAINPNIYGIASQTTSILQDLNCPLSRDGGNRGSTYNWQANADASGNDWYYESIQETGGATAGAYVDGMMSACDAASSNLMVTIPMLPYVATTGSGGAEDWSFSISKYGPQTGNDSQYAPDAGNGISTASGNPFITGNNPLDANSPNSLSLQLGWMQHLTNTWGKAGNGGVKYYLMDNEPSIWFQEHRDVHPAGPPEHEILNNIETYSGEVKSNDPAALVVAPEEWGWTGYEYSGMDQQYCAKNGFSNPPDMDSNGGMWYVPWLLQNLKAYDTAHGTKSIDVLSLHWYPQSGEYSNDDTAPTQLLRNESTRSLWDPTYTDVSWINSVVELIPRMQSWVNSYYPGLQTAITEYNWGDEANMNGATTVADLLGIFGAYGLSMASYWTVPATNSPAYLARKIYRNYDGNKSAFGDTSVSCTGFSPDNQTFYAAQRTSDSSLTIMAINKITSATAATINISNFTGASSAQRYQISSNTQTSIAQLSNISVSGGASISDTLPAQSITLYVIPMGSVTVPSAPTGLTAAPGISQIALAWNASSGAASYNVLRSTVSGSGYASVATGISATAYTNTGLTNGTTYYFVVDAVNSAGTSGNSNQASAAPGGATLPIQINTGGPAVSPFVADTDFSGGAEATNYTGAIVTTGLTNPAPQAVYQSERYASPAMTYTIPGLVAGTTYTVRLHMCENYVTASGQRVFDVFVNGTEVLTNFDIFATTGANYKATIQQFNEPANSNGQFVITFTNVTNFALLDGIEVVAVGGSAPAAPSGLTATPGNAQVGLSWTASSGATSYNVLRSTTSGSGYAQVANVTTTSYTNTGLTNGTTYYFVVVALNAYGTSANSSQVSAKPQVSAPSAPTGLSATAGNSQVSLTWNASAGATSYNVLRSTTSGSGYVQVTNVTTTSYTNTGLTNGTTYYYVVAAVNAGGTSANSNQASATPTGSVSLPIQINTGGPAVSPFVADSDYSGGAEATNYTGAIVTSGLTNPAPQVVYQSERFASPAMSYTIPGLTAGTTYTVRLHFCENYFSASGSRVFDVSINGTQVLTNFDIYAATGAAHTATIQQFNEPATSNGQFVITFTNVTNFALINGIEITAAGGSAPAAPTGLIATPGNAQVALAWSSSSGATSYNVLRSTTSGSGYAQVTNVTTTAYTNTGLTNGTTYYFVVAAVNSYGSSANSGQASATPSSGSGNTHSGTWAAKGVFTTTATWNNLDQIDTVTANSTYTASFWMKGTGVCLLRIFAGNFGTQITQVGLTASSTWQQATVSFSTGSNTQLTFDLCDTGGVAGTAYMDDCFMGVANGTNVLGNPGFESGNTVWSVNSPFSIVDNP